MISIFSADRGPASRRGDPHANRTTRLKRSPTPTAGPPPRTRPDFTRDRLWRSDQPVRHNGRHPLGETSHGPDRRECARSPRPHVSLSVMAGPVATHRAAAPSCTPATWDRTDWLHRDVRRRPEPPAYSMIPSWRPPPGPGSSGVRRHPAGSPAIPEPGPRARRHTGVPAGLPFTPCAVTLDQLHRPGDGLRAAGTTDGTPAHHGNPGRPCRRHVSAFIRDHQVVDPSLPAARAEVWESAQLRNLEWLMTVGEEA
jgi:hypothetical protein